MGAEGVLEPAAGPADVPAPPVIGVPGIVDAGDQMGLAVGMGLITAQDGRGGGQDRLIVRHVALQGIQPAERAAAAARDDRQENPRGRR